MVSLRCLSSSASVITFESHPVFDGKPTTMFEFTNLCARPIPDAK